MYLRSSKIIFWILILLWAATFENQLPYSIMEYNLVNFVHLRNTDEFCVGVCEGL